jgi:hypothetical protein
MSGARIRRWLDRNLLALPAAILGANRLYRKKEPHRDQSALVGIIFGTQAAHFGAVRLYSYG